MSRTKSLVLAALLVAISVFATACAQDEADPGQVHDSEAQFAFGSPDDAGNANRVIEIRTSDALAFEPSEITVSAGEVVTFRIINEGSLVHDFTLGDQATQDEHEAEMAETEGMAHEEPNVVLVSPGETADLTWRFGESGTVLIGCHQPGHYASGMSGQIVIDG